ncbi:MAG: hypothetical protein DCC71_11010 [Proteobacteria bacterium]|nr:MAG: hypothetical protein DCC71_11010 [Pseudomonadota bacterium]
MFPKRQSGLAIVKTTWFAHEAHLARALLESQGIEAWVLDAQQVGVQWHVAGAIGGIKVAVAPEDAERARTLLAEDRSDALAEIDEAALPAPAEERCPRCGSPDVASRARGERPGGWAWLSMGLFFALGFLVPRRRRLVRSGCRACGAFWVASA